MTSKTLSRLSLGALLAACAAPALHADFTLTGRFLYRDRAFTYSGGFTGNEPGKPIRFARVLVVDDSTGSTIVTTTTDDNGDISVLVPGSGTRDIVVRAESQSQLFGFFRIRAETTSSVLYSVSSSVFSNWDQDTDLDVGTTVSEKITSAGSVGNPFNMLDQGVAALEYTMSLGSGNPTGTIRMRWPGGGGSFASGFTATMADDDGYDDIVQLHELGHVFHNMFSDSDSPGGSHSFGDSDQDPRLSYGEGWASFFAGAVRQHQGLFDPGFYMDCNGSGGTGGIQLRARFENASPYQSSTGGEATEVGVACVLWDIVDTASTNDGNSSDDDDLDGTLTFTGGIDGDQMHWNTFTGPVAAASNLTIRNHWDAFFTPFDYGNHPELEDIFDAFEIRNYLDASEPNNSQGTATPYTQNGGWTPIRTLYYSTASPPAPGAGDSDYFSFDLINGELFEVETRYPNGNSNAHTYADTFLRVYRPNGTQFATNDDKSPTDRNAWVTGVSADATGTWTAQVTTTHSYRRTGSYQFRVGRTGAGISGLNPTSIVAASALPQQVFITGFGFLNTVSVTIDGVPLVAGVSGSYLVNGDTQITATVPLLTKTGLVDVVVTTTTDTASAQLQVDPVPSPLLITPVGTTQTLGIQVVSAAALLDWTWVAVSVFNTPTVFPGLFSLGIGNNNQQIAVIWKPLVLTPGYAAKSFGPLSDLAGVTLYFQSIVLEAANSYNPPWSSSNVSSTIILF
jgi:hypothetical protein